MECPDYLEFQVRIDNIRTKRFYYINSFFAGCIEENERS